MRKLALVAALLASALSLFMISPAQAEAPSSAQPNPELLAAADAAQVCHPDGCGIGYALFAPDGDHIWVCDAYSDGRGIRVSVWNQTNDPDTHEYYLTDANGSGNDCVHRSAADLQPWNLAETHCFSFGVYQVNNGEQVGDRFTVQLRNYNNDGPVLCEGVD